MAICIITLFSSFAVSAQISTRKYGNSSAFVNAYGEYSKLSLVSDYYAYSGSYGGTNISGYSATVSAKIYNKNDTKKKTCKTLTLTKKNNSKLEKGTTLASNRYMTVTVNVKGLGLQQSFTVYQ